jgi:flagellar biosynthesis protein FlhB
MSHHMHETGSEQEGCANFTPAMQSVQSDFRRATLNVSTISPCTGLQNWWFLMHWKEGLKELLNIKFSFIVHLWTCAQILMETATSLSSLADD